MIDFAPVIGKSDRRWLRWLDAECFPKDVPAELGDGDWYLGWNGDDAVAFCGWEPVGPWGFLARAGVLWEARGQKLQRRMIEMREDAMRRRGLATAVTYTETYSAASMRNLIACGYRPFEADTETTMAPADRWRHMVHWRKEI